MIGSIPFGDPLQRVLDIRGRKYLLWFPNQQILVGWIVLTELKANDKPSSLCSLLLDLLLDNPLFGMIYIDLY